VVLGAIVEYLTAELCELAGNRVSERMMSGQAPDCILPIDLLAGVNQDGELWAMLNFLPGRTGQAALSAPCRSALQWLAEPCMGA
jgi:hypothetical protein